MQKVVNECPLCGQVVSFKEGVNPNDAMVDHMDKGCPKEVAVQSKFRYPCHAKGCKVEEITQITCGYCRLNHCVAHRTPEKHNCQRVPAPKTDTRTSTAAAPSSSSPLYEAWLALQSRIDLLRSSSGSKPKSGPSTKNKSAAIGNKKLPEQDRIYLEVLYPVDSGIEPKWMFFDAKHPAGRALDTIAEEGKISNLNNISTARKLALVDIGTGEPIKLQTPLKTLFRNGDTILLEYTDVLAQSSQMDSSSSSPSPSPVPAQGTRMSPIIVS